MIRIPSIYPLSKKIIEPYKNGAGRFVGSQPMGVTIHHTADRRIDTVLAHSNEKRVGYHFLIERNGNIIQTAYLDSRVNHAGLAEWNGFSPNSHHAAIGLLAWGDLKRVKPEKEDVYYETWAKGRLPESEVAYRVGNQKPDKFYWDAATPAQLKSLDELLYWFIGLGIRPEDVCGHDECALPFGRKVDPGGTLPVTMKEYRERLKAGLRF